MPAFSITMMPTNGSALMIEFHDPTGASAQTVESYDLVFDMAANAEDKPTIGLLANGFADSERFLSLIGDAITARYPSVNLNYGIRAMPQFPRLRVCCKRYARAVMRWWRLTATEAVALPAPCVTALTWLA